MSTAKGRSPARRAHIRAEAGPVPRADLAEAEHPVSIVTNSAAFIEPVDPLHRHRMVAEAAFYMAQRRRFDPGHDIDDWLAAEQAIDATLNGGSAAP